MSALINKLAELSKISNDDLEHFRKASILNYQNEGISIADTEELKIIINDVETYCGSDDEDVYFVPIHAWRALAQMNPSSDTVAFLLENKRNPYLDDMDWLTEDLINIIEAIGQDAIQPIDDFLSNNKENTDGLVAIEGLSKIPQTHSALTDQCVTVLSKHFANYATQNEDVNGFLLMGLLNLNAALPHIDLIRAAFEADKVDEFCAGDIEDVEINLGLRTERATPRRAWDFGSPQFAEESDSIDEMRGLSNKTTPNLSKKEQEKRKAKNKQAKQARKKNRKK
jgi:hypothetical protein